MHIQRYTTPSGNDRYRAIVQHKGRKVTKSGFLTQSDAKMAGAELLLELGATPDPAETTLGELLLLHVSQSELAITTETDYLRAIRMMPDWMKNWHVDKVTTMMLEQAYRRLLNDGRTVHRVRRIHEILGPAFERAVRWGWVPFNPVRSAKQPSRPEVEMVLPTPSEVMRILDAADKVNADLGCALELVAHTGVRRGEVCALQWADLRGDELVVRRSVSTTTTDARRLTLGKTGKGGHRVVPLAPSSLRALKAHRARQAATALERGQAAPLWVFTHDGQHTWRTDYVTLAFSRIRDDLGIDTHLHAFRHFAATEWITAGTDIRTVSYLLGHARTSTTLDIYASYMPAAGRDAVDHLEHRLRRG